MSSTLPPQSLPSREVALFMPCHADLMAPSVGIAITRVLEHFGCTVRFPRAQTCCGRRFLIEGLRDESLALAKRMIGLFEGYDHTVAADRTCCQHMAVDVPASLAGNAAWEPGARRLADRLIPFDDFLLDVLQVRLDDLTLDRPTRVAYAPVESYANPRDSTRALLGTIAGVHLLELTPADAAVGNGGSFADTWPSLRHAAAENCVDVLVESKAAVMICDDAADRAGLDRVCRERGVDVAVMHSAELIARAMGMDVTQW